MFAIEPRRPIGRRGTMLIRRIFTYAALTIVALAGLGGLWLGNLLPLRAGLATPERPSAKLLIASTAPRILFQTHAGNPADTEVEYQRYLKTQMVLMKTRFVFNSALQRDGISKSALVKSLADPIEWLEKNLEVSRLGDSELLEVSLPSRTGFSTKEQAWLINAVVGAYIDEVVNKDRQQMRHRQETLKKLLKDYSDMMKTRRDTIRKLATASHGQTISDREEYALSRLHLDLRTRAIDLTLERVKAEALLKWRRKSESRSSDQAQKEIAQLQDQLVVLEAQQKAIQHELELSVDQMQKTSDRERASDLDLTEYQDDLKQIQLAATKIGAALEELNVELQAPPRVTLVEKAEAD
jgi:hypothetical protein